MSRSAALRLRVLPSFRALRSPRSPGDRRALFAPRRPTRWLVVAVAALLNLAAPTASTAQGADTKVESAPGPMLGGVGPSSLPGSTRRIVDDVQIDFGYTYDDNVTRARADDEILADQFLALNASASRALRIDDHAQLVVTGLVSGEKFNRYNGLSNLSGGVEAELQYRQSGAFDAITYAAFARGFLANYASHLRDGSHFSFGVSARGAVTDRIGVSAELERKERRAKSEVWDLSDYAARLNLDYSLDDKGTLYLTGEYRRGDAVSTGRATLVNVSLADVFVLDDAFPGKELFAYRSDARTWLGTIGYNVPLGQQASIDISWRRAESTPTRGLGFDAQSSLRYVDNQYSIVFLKRF